MTISSTIVQELSNLSLDKTAPSLKLTPYTPSTLETVKNDPNPIFTKDTPKEIYDAYEYADYRAYWPEVDEEPLDDNLEVIERARFADPTKKNLLGAATKVTDLSPVIGTEIHGIRLENLTEAQKDELALLVAERGVVFFRDQKTFTPEKQIELVRHWGPLHKHARGGVPKKPGLDEAHVVYGDASKGSGRRNRGATHIWHSDVSYELQPPSYTCLHGFTIPPVGGDTMWVSEYAVYDSLSPEMQKYLEGLEAVHSAGPKNIGKRENGNWIRRPPSDAIHPVIITNPATGWKSVYVSPLTTSHIIGLSKSESDAILNMLYDLMSGMVEAQVRFKWQRDSVAIWDNRSTAHCAISDFYPHTRLALRVAPHGARPRFDPAGKSREAEMAKVKGV